MSDAAKIPGRPGPPTAASTVAYVSAGSGALAEESLPCAAPLRVGDHFAGAYRIFAVKRGGMGQIFLAQDMQALGRGVHLNVAIKSVPDLEEWQLARTARGASADAIAHQNLPVAPVGRRHRRAGRAGLLV